ncbi:MAG: glycosyltransferase, partial [Solirubrobacteraceae bacterium]
MRPSEMLDAPMVPDPRAVAADALVSVPVLGIPLALTDYERTMLWMDAMVASRQRGYVCVAAVHTVMACQEDEELRAAVLGSDLTVPDG